MTRNEAMAEAIKNLEPVARVQGRVISWEKFNQQFNSGNFSEQVLVPQAQENSLADPISGLDNSQEL